MSKELTKELLFPKRLVVVMTYTFGWNTPPALVIVNHPDGRYYRYAVQANHPLLVLTAVNNTLSKQIVRTKPYTKYHAGVWCKRNYPAKLSNWRNTK